MAASVSPEGLRQDGRRPHEVRRVAVEFGLYPKADGSVKLSHGLTSVVATVFGPRELTFFAPEAAEAAIISAEVKVSPFAASQRRRRGRFDRECLSIADTLRETIASVVLADLYPRSEIAVCVHVLCDDGGVWPAAVNAATLALVNAGIPMRDLVAACSAGVSRGVDSDDDTVIVDLSRTEMGASGASRRGDARLNVAVSVRDSQVVAAQLVSRLKPQQLETVMGVAVDGCLAVAATFRKAVKDHSATAAAVAVAAPGNGNGNGNGSSASR